MTALVADDNQANRDVLASILRHLGIKVYTAGDGQQVIDRLAATPCDIVYLDLRMPVVDGEMAFRHIQEMFPGHSVKCVAVTALSQAEDIVAGFNAGAVDYINKPIDQQEVCARVNLHISHQQRLKSGEITANAAIMTACPPGLIESANPVALQLFGYRLMELIGKPLSFFLSPESARECARAFEAKDDAALEYGHAIAPARMLGRHRNGAVVNLDFSIRRLSLPYPLYVCLM